MTHRRLTIARTCSRGFTLVELLVVISIILLLMGLTLGAGSAVIRSRTAATTKSILQTLDRALEEYIVTTNGVLPKYLPDAYRFVPGDEIKTGEANDLTSDAAFPPYKGRNHPRFPDTAVFLKQAAGFGVIDSVIANIPDRFLFITRGDKNDINGEGDIAIGNQDAQDLTPSIADAWLDRGWAWPWQTLQQHLILYVHPDNELAQAMYGRCINRRPYFLSAGPDGKYGAKAEFSDNFFDMLTSDEQKELLTKSLKDNLYSYPLNPLDSANLTAEFNNNTR